MPDQPSAGTPLGETNADSGQHLYSRPVPRAAGSRSALTRGRGLGGSAESGSEESRLRGSGSAESGSQGSGSQGSGSAESGDDSGAAAGARGGASEGVTRSNPAAHSALDRKLDRRSRNAEPSSREPSSREPLPKRSGTIPVSRPELAWVGKVLHRKWRLDTLLGVGGMASVFAATHRNGSRVAVKILHRQVASDESVRRFLREGYIANSVEHPGVVKVLDDDVAEDGSHFIVMELLRGESVESILERRKTLEPASALAIVEQALEVLEAAHHKGIVHRDIKPENILLCVDGRVKILDFGIARHSLRPAAPNDATRYGLLMGTPSYMPPEQARGDWESVGARTDLWAIGATLFRALTGRVVHEEKHSFVELLAAASRDPAPTLVSVRPDLGADLATIVDRALAFDPSARWASATEMLAAVRRALKSSGHTSGHALLESLACELVMTRALPEVSDPDSAEFDLAGADSHSGRLATAAIPVLVDKTQYGGSDFDEPSGSSDALLVDRDPGASELDWEDRHRVADSLAGYSAFPTGPHRPVVDARPILTRAGRAPSEPDDRPDDTMRFTFVQLLGWTIAGVIAFIVAWVVVRGLIASL